MYYSPQYLRHRPSTTDEESHHSQKDLPISWAHEDQQQRQQIAVGRSREQELRLAGLRRRGLVLLLAWLALLMLIVLFLLAMHISLVSVLQLSPRGMNYLRIFTYDDPLSGKAEPAVQFSAANIHLGKVVASSGRVVGPREGQLDIRGSGIFLVVGNRDEEKRTSRAILQDGQCRLEGADNFQVRQLLTGKLLFSARHPLVGIDPDRIKRVASSHIVTNKLRSPVDEPFRILAKDLGLRGNERLQMEARRVNMSAVTGIWLNTSEDGSLHFSAHRMFLGSKWRPLALSPSPALTASVDAFRVCVCQAPSWSAADRPKLFLVPGNKPCRASSAVCQ